MERRRSPRIYDPFPVLVRSRAGRQRVEAATVLDNIGGGGLHLVLPRSFCERAPRSVEVGSELLFYVRFTAPTTALGRPAARVVLSGRVVRVEPQVGGAQGIAVTTTRFRFLPPHSV